jgi:hypothetical protein
METMHAAGRRSLPPVPRTRSERVAVEPAVAPAAEPPGDTPTEPFVVDLATGEQRTVHPAEDALGTPAPDRGMDRPTAHASAKEPDSPPSDAPAPEVSVLDPGQQFVARLRAAAADFASAAGAGSAVVREAVPPARHRRARCRVVLHYPDDTEVDVTFLGPAGRPAASGRHGFDRQIRRWLMAGQRRDDAWVVADADAPDGLAVDLSAWVAAA